MCYYANSLEPVIKEDKISIDHCFDVKDVLTILGKEDVVFEKRNLGYFKTGIINHYNSRQE